MLQVSGPETSSAQAQPRLLPSYSRPTASATVRSAPSAPSSFIRHSIMPMALRRPSGIALWPGIPSVVTRTPPASACAVTGIPVRRPQARTCSASSSPPANSAVHVPGITFTRSPARISSTCSPDGGLAKRSLRCKRPFSVLMTGKSASGLKPISGISVCAA